ncbi:hypothetical protein O0I10_012359 [Lichtheimia ornata]|uniref:Uncharacterized protein n=1 Tax=Lichtheimia ornata TaxID=688661 RepID=A0AAD7URR0_9FUNG|nr:uncharacterized protein O0I10_012359 [Lichtheimia ornata]KAJ8652015.1 hypothetical protein O0I10_012359 [Lichtheimia ornata]
MNRLGFGDFHAAHFSPQQVEQWKHLLQRNLYPSWQPYQEQQQQQQYQQEPTMNDAMEEEVDQQQDIQDDQDQHHGLSKEAIEIFRFSEAYRKEREAAEREQGGDEDEDEDQGTFDDEPYICNGLHKGGIETPANRLIHIDTEAEYSEQVVIQERFLDAEYIKACQTKDSPVVLWPVVPLR